MSGGFPIGDKMLPIADFLACRVIFQHLLNRLFNSPLRAIVLSVLYILLCTSMEDDFRLFSIGVLKIRKCNFANLAQRRAVPSVTSPCNANSRPLSRRSSATWERSSVSATICSSNQRNQDRYFMSQPKPQARKCAHLLRWLSASRGSTRSNSQPSTQIAQKSSASDAGSRLLVSRP
jgi:hypothetical protein